MRRQGSSHQPFGKAASGSRDELAATFVPPEPAPHVALIQAATHVNGRESRVAQRSARYIVWRLGMMAPTARLPRKPRAAPIAADWPFVGAQPMQFWHLECVP